ncbi:hypothetical protein AHAS_Ahas19G0200000 [Arachis hypogaea]
MALARDSRRGNNNKGCGKHFQPRDQNFNRGRHASQHPKVKEASGKPTMTSFICRKKEVNALLVDYLDLCQGIALMGETRMQVRTNNKVEYFL